MSEQHTPLDLAALWADRASLAAALDSLDEVLPTIDALCAECKATYQRARALLAGGG